MFIFGLSWPKLKFPQKIRYEITLRSFFKVMEGGAAAADGRISVGDRLVAVKNIPGGVGDFFLENCTHEEAVNALKKCKDKVNLLVAKGETQYPSSPTIGNVQF